MAPQPYVVLLRGINVGGKNLLPMKDLIKMFEAAKCDNVRTHIQSGNILFNAHQKIASTLPEKISAQITKSFSYKIPVILRNAAEMEEIVAGNPFLKTGCAVDLLHVLFLAAAPELAKITELDAKRSPPDEFAVKNREVYLRLPNGAGRTKLTNAYFDSKLGVISTQRNWRTITTLAAMLLE
jgi:uncharacterized protein (DUF1697 family)